MGLSQADREREANAKALREKKASLDKMRAEQVTTDATWRNETYEQNYNAIFQEVETIAKLGKAARERGIEGYDTFVTVHLKMRPGNEAASRLVSAIMIWAGSRMFLYPANALGRLLGHTGEDLYEAIASQFTDVPKGKVQGVQFFVELTDDGLVDMNAIERQVCRTNKDPLTVQQTREYSQAFADWIESTQGGKYEFAENAAKTGLEIYEKTPGLAPGVKGHKVTKEEFRVIRDDPKDGFNAYLLNLFGKGFEQLASPPQPPSPGRSF